MRPIAWHREDQVPRCVAAVLDALRFDDQRIAPPDAPSTEWDQAIYYLNRNQLTLIAGSTRFPAPLESLIDGFYRANCFRLSRLRETTGSLIAQLQAAGIEPVLLKGFARTAEYLADTEARMHYDIDLFCPEQAHEAQTVLFRDGYRSLEHHSQSDVAGHLTPLARPTSWRWRNDFFDLETPVHIELHEQLWTGQVERFAFSGLEGFWTRREKESGRAYFTFNRHDTLAYRCLHLLRHLLRGDPRAASVHEIAYFLHQNRSDENFWTVWRSLYSPDLHLAQAACFALAQRWFGCAMHEVPAAAVRRLPQPIAGWMEHSAASPVESFFRPVKSELALHFALIDALTDSRSAKLRVALRRLLPLRHTGRMWEPRSGYLARLGSRAVYHARALAPTLSRLWMTRRRYPSIEKRSSN